jgi:hypothetical protein
MSNSSLISSAIALVVVSGLLIAFGPIFTIWALNLIFNLSIPTTFWTWLSTAWLSFLVVGYKKSSKE